MCRRRGLWLGGLAVAWVWATAAGAAAAPWDKILTVRRVDADPAKEYTLTEKNGPWMILACSFSPGEDDEGRQAAQRQAKALILEIRKRYKLPAYVYEKKFELEKRVAGRGVDELGNPRMMKYKRGAQNEEIAVLVGDYAKADDPEAQEVLRKLKYAQPECLSVEKTGSTSRTLAALRTIQTTILPDGNAKKKKGPMGHAMVTTNPLLPDDFFVPKGVDELVVKANEGVEHCLLDCPGKYTVQVAHFTGKWIVNQKEIEAVEKGKEMESYLVEATEKAHRMTQALRKQGIEAYEFHDRYGSLVAVGSFDSVGQKDASGVLHLDPRIEATIAQFQAATAAQTADGTPAMAPRTLRDLAPTVGATENIPFDVQPRLIEAPKRSVRNALLGRGLAERF